jgi:hypothetical protein
MLGGLAVRQDAIDLVPLQGHLIPGVSQTQDELSLSRQWNSFFPMPLASYECSSARRSPPSNRPRAPLRRRSSV